jgi:hypothetical protein
MKTEYTIFSPGSRDGERCEVDWPQEPSYKTIAALIEPLIDGADLEHVTVLHDGERHDMFVDEQGAQNWKAGYPLPVNDRATEIYRCNWLTQHPEVDPASLPSVHGTAVLFHRIVLT